VLELPYTAARVLGPHPEPTCVRRKIDYGKALEAGKDAVARRIADELASQTRVTT
jgi:hypothetical protein